MMFNWLKKKPTPAPKKPKPQRVAVHCANGQTIVHYAVYREHTINGGLTLHNGKDGTKVVADYAQGAWLSISRGTRKVSK